MQQIELPNSKDLIDRLDPYFNEYSEMAPWEQEFLTGLIQKYKPKKVVEIGLAAGSSSVLLLNALSEQDNKELISVDYLTQYHRDLDKNLDLLWIIIPN